MKVLLPSRLRCCSISFCITRMAVMATIIEKTPTNTPNNVRDERSLCETRAFIAMRKDSRISASKKVGLLSFTL